MAEEEFEIDIYGDGDGDANGDSKHDDDSHDYRGDHDDQGPNGHDDGYEDDGHNEDAGEQSRTISPGTQTQPAPVHGVKRKEASDDRPVDPNATTSLLISEINWWNTDDEIRGWVRQAGCEEELRDITFSEHKVNGKSKG